MSSRDEWKQHYDSSDDHADDDPFPKMLDGEAHNILGPYVATETTTVVKVQSLQYPVPTHHASHVMTRSGTQSSTMGLPLPT